MPGQPEGTWCAVEAAREVQGILDALQESCKMKDWEAFDEHMQEHTYSGGCRRTVINLTHAAAALWHMAAAADPKYQAEATQARYDAADEHMTGT
jgi:hypothetical protein